MEPRFILRRAENIQKHSCLIFPTVFGFGHSHDLKKCYITCPFWGFQPKYLVKNCLENHHCLLSDSLVQILLMHHPFGHLSYQTLLISVHKLPQVVEELPQVVEELPHHIKL
jgi:hypothetical protein